MNYTKKERDEYNTNRFIICETLGITKNNYNWLRRKGESIHKIYEDNFLGLESDKRWWLGDEKLHYSHKGRLFEKDPEKYYFYSDYSDYKQLGFTCCETCNYYWPTHMEIA